mmetsp:Transcript_565/g.1351  ORF Transcript_565/g.1351 Transcript_565/m.1351 type:complete len:106 (-) Transcript_565:33-350(-)
MSARSGAASLQRESERSLPPRHGDDVVCGLNGCHRSSNASKRSKWGEGADRRGASAPAAGLAAAVQHRAARATTTNNLLRTFLIGHKCFLLGLGSGRQKGLLLSC